jgi:hypothetical protein
MAHSRAMCGEEAEVPDQVISVPSGARPPTLVPGAQPDWRRTCSWRRWSVSPVAVSKLIELWQLVYDVDNAAG